MGAPFLALGLREKRDSGGIRDLAVFRLRAGAVTRLHVVVHQNRRSVPQLEDTRTDHFITRIQSGNDSDLIPSRSIDLYDLLSYSSIRPALLVRHVGQDKD